jgi:exodeoxyribonuclease VII large subunit
MEPHLGPQGDAAEAKTRDGDEARPGADSTLPRFFSITQYNRSVERLVKREVPKIWVQGTITQLNVRGRVAYLTLAEFETDDAKPKAALDVFLWAGELEAFNARFAALPTPFQLKVMLKVAVQLEAGFYVPTGRFQPRILDVDARFTLGELALTRQKILAALKRDGLLTRNKALPLAMCPLRVGLITAPGSAAYQDFTTVLLQSGFSFEVLVVEARMQGERTESSVVAALTRLVALPTRPDCICIVRGGGSRTDLVYFDSEAICRAIATCPVPVLTGIGHEIDRSLADEVAHLDLITPTDCAKFLEERLQMALGALGDARQRIESLWREGLQQASLDLTQAAQGLSQAFAAAQARESQTARAMVARLQQGVHYHFEEAKAHVRRNAVGLRRGPLKLVASAQWRLRHRGGVLRGGFIKLGGAWREGLVSRRLRLLGVAQRLKAMGESLEVKSRWLRTLEPGFILRLGYALVRGEGGKPIGSVTEVASGEKVQVSFADGGVEAVIGAAIPQGSDQQQGDRNKTEPKKSTSKKSGLQKREQS